MHCEYKMTQRPEVARRQAVNRWYLAAERSRETLNYPPTPSTVADPHEALSQRGYQAASSTSRPESCQAHLEQPS